MICTYIGYESRKDKYFMFMLIKVIYKLVNVLLYKNKK